MEIILIGSLISAIIALDTTHFLQSMISQPIFACSILGLIFGEWQIGLTIGLIFEVTFLKSIPVGGVAFPENNTGSMGAATLLIAYAKAGDMNWVYFIPWGIMLGLTISFIGMKATTYHRRFNERFFNYIEKQSRIRDVLSRDLSYILFKSMIHYVFLMFSVLVIVTSMFFYSGVFAYHQYPEVFNNTGIWFWVSAFLFVGFARLMNIYLNIKRINF